ncbi:MAG: saccharopine dehydrogenase NADP-binding domain-containing protein [Candidatus Sungbacteria bacterium]|nr:saccharopine dehydrogenase NADP-binding domain-containing protein [Candidatus Sungbacteria bacterium]
MKEEHVVVLGAGMVGKAIAVDLNKNYLVTAVDINRTRLEPLAKNGVQTVCADISNAETLRQVIKDADLVVSAVLSRMGFATLKNIIEAGKNVVDITFSAEDPLKLDELAGKNDVIAIVDCGVCPGMTNIILGYHDGHMAITHYEALVGGLPVVRKWPWEYKAPFSPADVIEEYTRPARFVENGQVVTVPALSNIRTVEFDTVGTLEAFDTDGLRTLLHTMKHIPNMKEQTLRYPGHIGLYKALQASGFLSLAPIEFEGNVIRPFDFNTKIIMNKWRLGEQEKELTVVRLVIEGTCNGISQKITYNLFDQYDFLTQTTSMARTTGYTATGAARLILDGKFKRRGINPPEYIGRSEGNFIFMLDHLRQRGIHYKCLSGVIL